jgi:DNA-directed RNA polymerase subunit RPC12/RpoP
MTGQQEFEVCSNFIVATAPHGVLTSRNAWPRLRNTGRCLRLGHAPLVASLRRNRFSPLEAPFMSDGKAPAIACSRCGSKSIRTSRQALRFFAWVYCVTLRRQRYRCLSCNSRFYGRRRDSTSRQFGSDDHPDVGHRTADRNGAA